MNNHEHTIGVYFDYEETAPVTLKELREQHPYISLSTLRKYSPNEETAQKQYDDYCKEWERFFDLKCEGSLERFLYCPYCGEKLDWKKMKKEKWNDEADYPET